jgi:hypothetical protein
MSELRSAFADPALVAELQPEELGAKILFILRKRTAANSNQDKFHLHNELVGLWPHQTAINEQWARTSCLWKVPH